MGESYNLSIVLLLTVGFAFASILGYIAQLIKFPPILGYLLAGFLIGPHSPGFVADKEISEQLAEIGIILMMFGVGLHFRWEDLSAVKNIAVPGALGQTCVATLVSTIFVYQMGWSVESSLVIGLAISVASTVVLVRVLSDRGQLETLQGHIAVGWTIVEDIFTVLILILLPSLAVTKGEIFLPDRIGPMALVIVKFCVLALLLFTIGRRFVSYVLLKVARTRNHELFTLTVLALTFVTATGSAIAFGTSIALGAFLAGMLVGQTIVRHLASANALPMKEAFVVIFFLSIGMLFNPAAIYQNLSLFFIILGVIIIVKPLTAFLLIIALKHKPRVAWIVSISLAQIGEFSFILAGEAFGLKILPQEGYDVIVACALVSISLNPSLFKAVDLIKKYFERRVQLNSTNDKEKTTDERNAPRAILVGFGPVGQSVFPKLECLGFNTTIIEQNVDTVERLIQEKREAVFGDASLPEILRIANIERAKLLVITLPEISTTLNIIKGAKDLNPEIQILARTRYTLDQKLFKNLDVKCICCEEESINAFKEEIQKYNKFIS